MRNWLVWKLRSLADRLEVLPPAMTEDDLPIDLGVDDIGKAWTINGVRYVWFGDWYQKFERQPEFMQWP